MPFQPYHEKEAERELIKFFVDHLNKKSPGSTKILKLQDDNDDGKADGIIEVEGKKIYVEARRKGFPNHKGKVCSFKDGWETQCLLDGIYLNETTINNYIGIGFVFLVVIKGFNPRFAVITRSCVKELLKKPSKKEPSTNTKVLQDVKSVPLKWFHECYK